MSKCGVCTKLLSSEGDFATCGMCKKSYHFACTTVSESSWRSMGPERKGSWKCATCKNNSSKTALTRKNSDELSDKSEKSVPVNVSTDQVSELFEKRFKQFEARMSGKFKEFEDTLSYYGNQLSDMSETIKKVEQKNIMLEKRLEKQEVEIKELKKKARDMEVMVQDKEQRDNGDKIEITGFKEKAVVDENVFMKKLLEKTGCIGESGVEFKVTKTTRTAGNERGGSQTLVVQFKTMATRNLVLDKIKKEKLYAKMGDVVGDNNTNIYFNEYLTPYYKKLYFEARKVKKEKKYAFLWIKHGKILLKKNENSRIETLASMMDLGKM
uniref:PHD-type domain-containing protein n=1 Tax=Cacopsylla melanoneura TaxID=428564 RepID=A0A8D8TG69_9HEMI